MSRSLPLRSGNWGRRAGFVEAAQEFLASLNLKQLANLEPSEYPKWLEDQTQALMASFPLAERWGPARKSIIRRCRALPRCRSYRTGHDKRPRTGSEHAR